MPDAARRPDAQAARADNAPDSRLPRSASHPFVSVVMPVRNEADYVAGTLTALQHGDYPSDLVEILVIDGGSTDRTPEIVAAAATDDSRIKLLDNPAGSTPAGLNVGMRCARGDVIVRMDGHALPEPDYVRACVESLNRTGAWMVGGPMQGRGDTPFGDAVAVAISTPLGAGDARFRLGGEGAVDTVYLGAWPREVFDRIGDFDVGLLRNQDYELALRIRQAGGTVWLDPGIRSTTVVRGSWSRLASQYAGYGRGRAATTCRHPGSVRARQALPAVFVLLLAAVAVLALFAPSTRRLFLLLVGLYAAVVVSASVGARRSAPSSAGRWLPVVYPTIHLCWGAGFWLGLAQCTFRGRGKAPDTPDRNTQE